MTGVTEFRQRKDCLTVRISNEFSKEGRGYLPGDSALGSGPALSAAETLWSLNPRWPLQQIPTKWAPGSP